MSKNADAIEMLGTVDEACRGGLFRVTLTENGMQVLCKPCGKMRTNNIRILPGDPVLVELSLYDLTKGRITYRYKGQPPASVPE